LQRSDNVNDLLVGFDRTKLSVGVGLRVGRCIGCCQNQQPSNNACNATKHCDFVLHVGNDNACTFGQGRGYQKLNNATGDRHNQPINQPINKMGGGRWEMGGGAEQQQATRQQNKQQQQEKKEERQKENLQAPTGIEPVISCLLGKRFAI
jgi:hypothetical protein